MAKHFIEFIDLYSYSFTNIHFILIKLSTLIDHQ